MELECDGQTVDVTPLLVAEGREWGLPDPEATVSAPLGSTGRLRASWHGRLRLSLEAEPVTGGWRLSVGVEALRPLRIRMLGVRLRGMDGTRVLVDGYHSWDWAGTRDGRVPGRGWWGAMWGHVGADHHLRLALAGQPAAGALALQWDAAGTLDAVSCGEPLQAGERTGDRRDLDVCLRSGESFAADRLELTAHPSRGWAAAALPRVARVPGRRRAGWMSWNCLGASVTAGDVLVATGLVPAGGVILIDDGWEELWGDWRESARFGGAIPDLAAVLARSGHEVGLWVAPFLVDAESQAVADHPERLLRDADGSPVLDARSPRATYVLDASRPEVAAALHTLGVRLGSAGARVVKADFLYAGALPGVRRLGWSGIRALVRGVAALAEGFRSAAGEEAAIWACGAPAPAVAGVADACRSGGDAVLRVPNLFAIDPDPPTFVHGPAVVRAQTRNLAARSWLWGATLPCDVDAVTFGRVGDTPPVEEAALRTWVEMARRSGGPLLISDKPGALDPAGWQWIREMLMDLPRHHEQPADPLAMPPAPMSDDDFLAWQPDLPVDWERA